MSHDDTVKLARELLGLYHAGFVAPQDWRVRVVCEALLAADARRRATPDAALNNTMEGTNAGHGLDGDVPAAQLADAEYRARLPQELPRVGTGDSRRPPRCLADACRDSGYGSFLRSVAASIEGADPDAAQALKRAADDVEGFVARLRALEQVAVPALEKFARGGFGYSTTRTAELALAALERAGREPSA